MMKKILGVAAVAAMSMMFAMTALAQKDYDMIAVPYEQENAWAEIAMTKDDVVDTGLFIREEKDPESAVVGYLEEGCAVWVLKKGKEWTELYSGGVTGYIMNEYLIYGEDVIEYAKENSKEGVATQWEDVKLYSDANGDSEVIRIIEYGESFEVVEGGGHWIKVRNIEGETGFVSEDDVQKVLLLDTALTKEAYDNGARKKEPDYVEPETEEYYEEDNSQQGETYAPPTYTEPTYTQPTYTQPQTQAQTQPQTQAQTQAPQTEAPVIEEVVDDGSSSVVDDNDVVIDDGDDGSYFDADAGVWRDANDNVINK